MGRCPQGRGDRSVRGGPPLGGGGVPPQSVTSSAAMPKPSGGIRSFPSLSACGLPTPIVALACIGNVDIQVFSCADGEPYFLRRFASLHIASPERGGEPPLGGGGVSPCIIRYSSQPISQRVTLLFFFTEKKKKQKKKRVRLPLHYAAMYHTKITQETVTINSHQQKSPGGVTGGCCRRNTTLFTVEIGA